LTNKSRLGRQVFGGDTWTPVLELKEMGFWKREETICLYWGHLLLNCELAVKREGFERRQRMNAPLPGGGGTSQIGDAKGF